MPFQIVKIKNAVGFVMMLLLLVGCTTEKIADHTLLLPFDFSTPDKTYVMKDKLKEISGLAYVKKNTLACVNDEKGNVYLYNTEKEEVRKKIDFHGAGDFEGVAAHKSHIYVAESNGHIFHIKYKDDEKPDDVWNTPLKTENNVEGLCYDAANRQLLMACKGEPLNGNTDQRAVYAFDLTEKKLDPEPYLTINPDQLRQLHPAVRDFSPSAIAIDPLSKHIYILSFVDRWLLVCDTLRQPAALIPLPDVIYPQPEGITFDPQGNLYIASEGIAGDGRILFFERKAE